MFFECNLPRKAPQHLHYTIKDSFEATIAHIYDRTEKLNKALELSKLQPEAFQVIASDLFKSEEKKYGNVEHFDKMTPKQLSAYAKSVYVQDEPMTRLTFPNVIVLFDTAFATVKEWESLRHIGIGGSDAAVIEGTSKFVTLRSLYHNKCGTPIKLEQDAGKQAIFDRGHWLEDNVINQFCNLTGAKRIRDTRMFQSKTHPHCIADIDAILQLRDGTIRVFEAKTTVMENSNAWRKDKIPAYYITQMRHYPAVLNDDRILGTYIGCLFTIDTSLGGDYIGSQFDSARFISHYIERDRDLELEILDRNEEFWADYIDAEIEPARSKDFDKDLALVNSLNGPPVPNKVPVDLSTRKNLEDAEEYFKVGEQIAELNAKVEVLKGQQEAFKLQMIDSLKENTQGQIRINDREYYLVKYAPINAKPKCDLSLLQSLYPEVYANEAIVQADPNPSRRFTVTKKST